MPSLVAYDSPELLESSSRSVHRKQTPLDDPKTSQVLPEALTSKKRRVQTDRPVLNAARNQTTNHAHGTSGERSSSVHIKATIDTIVAEKDLHLEIFLFIYGR
ncbi:hypothetical protein Tco_1232570 [Tanacetum coccineum]